MKIITAVVNNPLFIEMQYKSFKKYVRGEYEFIVFNDAKDFPDFTNGNDITIKKQIQDKCDQLGINCINIPNQQHQYNQNPSIRCADSMNFILQYQLQNPNQYLIIDSDMFLINELDVQKYSQYHCAIVLQSRQNETIHYFWNGLFYFDITKMKNLDKLNWNCCSGCDVGGMMKEWLKIQMNENSEEIRLTNNNIYFIKHLSSGSWNINKIPDYLKTNFKLINFLQNDIRNENGNFFCEIYDNIFFHYRAGGNWRKEGLSLHNYLSEELSECFE